MLSGRIFHLFFFFLLLLLVRLVSVRSRFLALVGNEDVIFAFTLLWEDNQKGKVSEGRLGFCSFLFLSSPMMVMMVEQNNG